MFHVEPRFITKDGQIIGGESRDHTVRAWYSFQEKQLSFMKRLGNWIANLGFISVLVFVGLFFATNGGIILWLYRRYSKFKKGFEQTVKSLEESKAVERDAILKNSLSSRQDTEVKMLVDDIRRKI